MIALFCADQTRLLDERLKSSGGIFRRQTSSCGDGLASMPPTGKYTSNVVPARCTLLDRKRMVPPCRTTRDRETHSPRPDPFRSFVVKKGSNNFRCTSKGIPHPRS